MDCRIFCEGCEDFFCQACVPNAEELIFQCNCGNVECPNDLHYCSRECADGSVAEEEPEQEVVPEVAREAEAPL